MKTSSVGCTVVNNEADETSFRENDSAYKVHVIVKTACLSLSLVFIRVQFNMPSNLTKVYIIEQLRHFIIVAVSEASATHILFKNNNLQHLQPDRVCQYSYFYTPLALQYLKARCSFGKIIFLSKPNKFASASV